MKPTLVDQVAAMGVVDRLRFENHRVQDYMNTAAQKAQLVEKITAGYAAEGTVVPVEIIQQGVNQWYQNRLRFQDTELPWYWAAYIVRERWLKPLKIGVAVAAVLAGAWCTSLYIQHRTQVQTAATLKAVHAEVTALAERARVQLASADDRNQVEALAGRILADLNTVPAPTHNDLARLHYLEMMSRTPIRLLINPDNTQISGVEREFGGGGKAWYVIVKAVDAAGSPVKLHIKSRETGRESFTDTFGVRVSDARYETVRQDKVADGIVDQNIVGVKPVGKLTFDMEPGIYTDFILEW